MGVRYSFSELMGVRFFLFVNINLWVSFLSVFICPSYCASYSSYCYFYCYCELSSAPEQGFAVDNSRHVEG